MKATRFFALLLAVLGIGGCSTLEEVDTRMMAAYGVPTATYHVKGKVTDEQGNPIPDIEVSFYGVYYGSTGTPPGIDPFNVKLKTNSQGNYLLEELHYPYPKVRIQFEDKDGPANGGEFESETTQVDMTFKKDNRDKNPWYSGIAQVDVPKIKLKKK